MISTRSLARPPRKRNTIDAKPSMNHNTTFQHPETVESDSDKLVSLAGDSARHIPFYPYCQLHILPIMTRCWLPFKTPNCAEGGWKGFLVSFWMSKLKTALSWSAQWCSLPTCTSENCWLDWCSSHLYLRGNCVEVYPRCRFLGLIRILVSLVSWVECRNLCL